MRVRGMLSFSSVLLVSAWKGAVVPRFASANGARFYQLAMCDFAALDWNEFHKGHEREWLLPYDGELEQWVGSNLGGLPRHAPLLELGCGTSDLAARLYDDGWRNVTSIDISLQAVHRARAQYCGSRPELRYAVADARALHDIADGDMGAVVDKGTLDAICCGEGFDYEARRVASEAARVLAPGGRWLCISLMPPSVLRPLLVDPQVWSWVSCESLGEYHAYCAHRSRKGAMMNCWHWHPVEGGWRTRSRCPL